MPRAGPPTGSSVTKLPSAPPIVTGGSPPRATRIRAVPQNASTSHAANARRCEEQQVAEQVVEPVAAAVDQHDALRAALRSRRRTRARDRSRPSRPDGDRRSCPTRPRRRPRRDRPSRGRRRDGRRARRARRRRASRSRPRSRRRPSGSHSRTLGRDAVDSRRTRLQRERAQCRSWSLPPPELPGAGSRGRWRARRIEPTSAWPPSQPGSPELPMGVTPRAYPAERMQAARRVAGETNPACARARISGWRRAR